MKKMIRVTGFWMFLLTLCSLRYAFCADAAPTPASWFADNWPTIGAVLFAALSEIIGMSPLKSNSVVQFILEILGKAFAKKVAMVIFVCAFALTACGGTAALKTAQITKETAEATLYEARVLENRGVINADQFAEFKKAYDSLHTAQGALIDARLDYLASPTQDSKAALDAALLTLAADSTQLIDIARKYNIGEGVLWQK
jgi:hypothetical protein